MSSNVLLECLHSNSQVGRYSHVIGIDEVGWGAIAGPVVVAGAVLPFDYIDSKLKDSKRFTSHKARIDGAAHAKSVSSAHFIHEIAPSALEHQKVGKVLNLAQKIVAGQLLKEYPNSIVVVDGKHLIDELEEPKGAIQLALPKADSLIPAVSAASIIAKAHRDELMIMLGNLVYTEWEFESSKGYPTPAHVEKLEKWGPTRLHRLNIKRVHDVYQRLGWYEDVDLTDDV